MEKEGIHTLEGITSHGLSTIPHIKVDLKQKYIWVRFRRTGKWLFNVGFFKVESLCVQTKRY